MFTLAKAALTVAAIAFCITLSAALVVADFPIQTITYANLSSPFDLLLDHGGTQLVVGNFAPPALYIFSTNGTFIASWTLQHGPYGMIRDHNDDIYYAAYQNNLIVKVSGTNGSTLTSWSTGDLSAPIAVDIDEANALVFVANYQAATVTKWTLNGEKLIDTFPVGSPYVGGLVLHSDSYLYVTSGVAVVKMTTNGKIVGHFTTTNPPLFNAIGIVAYGRSVYVADSTNARIIQFDTESGRVVHNYTNTNASLSLSSVSGVLLQPQRQQIFACDAGGNQIVVFKLVNASAAITVEW